MTVDVQEMLGAERLVYGRIGNEPFTLRIDGTMAPPKSGDVLRLAIAPEHVHWFDAQSGARV
jgi:sn-glycerol 3-phosphate transport system ATP-binding protein